MKWITATNLQQWASTIGSRTELSALIAALVNATAKDINTFKFPTGDFAQLPGYDGLLDAKGVPPWVPDGLSVWEFGTGEDPEAKAEKDYDKRTQDPRNVEPATATFVFVTPQPWQGPTRTSFVAARKAEGKWADVRVVDALDLEAWLDGHEAVAARFATKVLRLMPPQGVYSALDFWDEYAARTRARLTEQVVLAGRGDEADQVRRLLAAKASRIVVRGDSRDEALAFVIAALRTGDPGLKQFIESRAIVVDTDDAARSVSHRSDLVVGMRSPTTEYAGLLLERGNSVILPLGNDAPNQRDAIRLKRPARADFADALKTMGFQDQDAERIARECGRSVTILLRRIPAGVRHDPDWLNEPSNKDALIPVLFAGSWDSDSSADKEALAKLSGMDYSKLETQLRPLLRVADPPIQQIGTVWTVVAPVDLFEMLAEFVPGHHLETFKSACQDVLGEIDPAVDLPVDERQYASLHGKVPRHSSWLRDGITQTLLLIAVRGDDAHLNCAGGAQGYANRVLNDLPGLARDQRLMASLNDQLPLLMEAAPDPLLLALEQLLEGEGRKIVDIFAESGSFGPSSYHTGLLWALELLAWDPKYFDRSVSALVKLARIDPGGKLANRPLGSLRTIFLPWLPSTNAPLAMRLATLDSVIVREPEVGWQLLASLLPSFHDSSTPTYKPRWRDAGASERESLTRRVVSNTHHGVIERALQQAGDDPDRWEKVITSMHAFGGEDLAKVRNGLDVFVDKVTSGPIRFKVWSILREEVNKHKRFESADWALRKDDLGPFEDVLKRLEPEDPVDQHVWLFDQHHPDLPEPYERSEDNAADEPRRRAITTIVAKDGLDGLLRLARRAKLSGLVGASIVAAIPKMTSLQELVTRALAIGKPLETLAAAISGEAARELGVPWIEWVISEARKGRWTGSELSTTILFWPDVQATWKVAASFGADVERLYWTNKPMLRLDDPGARTVAIRQYIAVGRAVMALAHFSHRSDGLPSDLLLDLVDACLKEVNAGLQPSSNFSFELAEVLGHLAKQPDVEQVEVAKREYAFLPILDYTKKPLVLHHLLTSEPALYVEILSDVYRAASEPADRDTTENQRRRAAMGYRLLQSLVTVPGSDDKGGLDGATMRNWVLRVRDLANKADRTEICDYQVGRLLAYAPKDGDDKAWPHRAVRDLLEELRSNNVEDAMRSEQTAKRGAYMKALYEGGDQERLLARQAQEWARASQNWPRTSAMLERIAEMWDAYAAREDDDVEKHKARFK